jgi:hypothetical protein
MIFSDNADEVFSKTITKVKNICIDIYDQGCFVLQIYIALCWLLLAAPLPLLYTTPNFIFQFDPFFGTWGVNGIATKFNVVVAVNITQQNLLFYAPLLAMAIYAIVIIYLLYQVGDCYNFSLNKKLF